MNERDRIRALVVARMSEFRDLQARQVGSAHVWEVAYRALRGLLIEIDAGVTVQDLRQRTPAGLAAIAEKDQDWKRSR